MKKLLMLLVISIGVFLCGCELDISVEPSSSASSSASDEIILGENDIESEEDIEQIDESEEEPLDYEGLKESLSKGEVPDYVYKVTIERVVDGDTMKLKLENGQSIRIRTLLIDCPEDTKEKDYLGDVATAFAKDKLKQGDVAYVETDGPLQDDYDRYLGYLWYQDGNEMKMYNAEILREGLARVAYIKEGVRHLDVLYDAQYEAKDQKLNVWSIDGYVTKYGFNQDLVD
ncbi:MAG: thermonuclease family protein [Intestinibacter sp.]|uniref:thermonuclease family protein n=1 Tax=Intestinibacter sp. TaxID=1965304 RepID=UPI003F146399